MVSATPDRRPRVYVAVTAQDRKHSKSFTLYGDPDPERVAEFLKAVVDTTSPTSSGSSPNHNVGPVEQAGSDSDFSTDAVAAESGAFPTSTTDGTASAVGRQDAATFEDTRDSDGPSR